MRWKRATRSVWVYENTWPTWSEPLTVGGGVSIEYTWSRERERSNRYVPDASHCAAHFASRPSRAGFSGTDIPTIVLQDWSIRRLADVVIDWMIGNHPVDHQIT